MNVPIFQVDAFASRRFAGNPAAVMVLGQFCSDSVLQAVAAENNLAETAFLVADGDDFRLRWFTPTVEVPLCGHATLASAAVVMERLAPQRREVVFQSASGPLRVKRTADGYAMDFPARPMVPVGAPMALVEALGAAPVEVAVDAFNYLARLPSATEVRGTSHWLRNPDVADRVRMAGADPCRNRDATRAISDSPAATAS